MKQFSNYDKAKKAAQSTGSSQLPVGAYVAKVMKVRYEEGQDGNSDRIVLQYDIAEGEQKGFFKNQYDQNQNEDKKWKGRATVYIPRDDGTEKDGWTANAFAKWTTSFEDSNDGYSWDWDEKKWEGKLIGLVFRKAGDVIEGREVTYTEIAFPISAKKVREGKAPEAKFKAKHGWTGTQKAAAPAPSDDFVSIPEGTDEEIPF